GSTFSDRFVWVYRQNGSGPGGLTTVACAGAYFNGQSSATFSVQAGTTYYIQAGGVFSWSTGTLDLSVQSVPPPANDDLADAGSIGTLPFSDTADLTAATTEPAGPSPGSGCFGTSNSVWYSFTPATTGSITSSVDQYGDGIAVYTGSSLGGLSRVGCTSW